jgi:hypothetical protein
MGPSTDAEGVLFCTDSCPAGVPLWGANEEGIFNNACHNGGYQSAYPNINSDCNPKAIVTLSAHLAACRPDFCFGSHNGLVSLFGILPR